MTRAPSAAIFGCAGFVLSDQEKRFFEQNRPLGYILFARNVETPAQVKALCQALKDLHDDDPLILIDQEGGRVQRLRPPHWENYPAMRGFGTLFETNPEQARQVLRQNNALLGADLAALGITVSCAPDMDVPVPGAHDVIGDRAFSENPEIVRDLARPACDGLYDAGIIPVIKHLPGHGRAMSDSHKELPRISTPLNELRHADFLPFRDWDAVPCFAMTAHVVLEDVDASRPITTSKSGIEDIIRGELGFDGLLMSDDIGMEALEGSFSARTEACLEAGCDVVLHCSGDFEEMQHVAGQLVPLSDRALASVAQAQSYATAQKKAPPPTTLANVKDALLH